MRARCPLNEGPGENVLVEHFVRTRTDCVLRVAYSERDSSTNLFSRVLCDGTPYVFVLQALSRWKTSILVVSVVLAVGLFLSRHLVGPFSGGSAPAGPVSPEEATQYSGQRTEVCGEVAEVTYVSRIGGNPTFINLGETHPDQSFTALIWEDDRRSWNEAPEGRYGEEEICVTGTVRLHEGTPQIVVSSPRQIRVR